MEELGDSEWLTQYGNRKFPPGQPFRIRPRQGRETSVSLVAGRLSIDEVAQAVNPHRAEGAHPDDGARYIRVGALREAGFRVERKPTQRMRDHVSVWLDAGEEWTEDVGARFNACAEETVWKEDPSE